jgi:hypothetical protein
VDITQIILKLQQLVHPFGLPTGAFVLAYSLVLMAKLYEADASEAALKDVSHLLINGNLTNLGTLVARLVPKIFDRVFRPNVIWQFILRSMLVTTIVWIILLMIRNPHPFAWQLRTFSSHRIYNTIFILFMYAVDIISLVKARILINLILMHYYTLAATIAFVCIDVAISYLLPLVLFLILAFTPISPLYGAVASYKIGLFVEFVLSFRSITDYLYHQSQNIHLITVVNPSTLFTSAWTMLLVVSSIIVMLLIPVDYLRRFTAWWFRDIEKRPVTSLAKVAATLIVIGGILIQAIRSL